MVLWKLFDHPTASRNMFVQLQTVCFTILLHWCLGDVFTLTSENRTILDGYRVALIQFSAEWCPFSKQLTPIFSEASNNFIEETKNATVFFGRVDCVASGNLCTEEKIDKYPTIKILRYGVSVKKQYRGVRTVEALTKFVQEQSEDMVRIINAEQQPYTKLLNDLTVSANSIIGLFTTLDSANVHLQHFKRASHLERDSCDFYLFHNFPEPIDRLAYKEPLSQKVKEITKLMDADFPAVHSWIRQKCTPFVRELTFANAEEITDESLPLLILFYHETSAHLKVKLDELVRQHFADEIGKVNFLTADGVQFSHPLKHLGKSVDDLPCMCIDSLTHMFGHPDHPENILSDPIHLKQFIADLRSGKLHTEFHFGRQPEIAPQKASAVDEHSEGDEPGPKHSVFKKLRSSYLKYSLLHDEL